MPACRACGQSNPDTARYCVACGTLLVLGTREERKVVTVLFCDLVELTPEPGPADPEDVVATLTIFHGLVRREIQRFGGAMEKFIGDAVMAVYGAPISHEDDAQRALLSAMRILPAIEDHNRDHPDSLLAVRIGIATGEAIVALGAEVFGQGIATGDVVNTASRLQEVTPAGWVVVEDATYRVTKDKFVFDPLEPVHVKGKADPIRIWRARSSRARFGAELQQPPSTAFVDREDELELLKRTFARAVRERSVQLVTLIGEPGIGKSRLLREFFAYTDDLPQLQFWRQGRCLPYGEGVTFWALGAIVKAQAGILESDGPEEAEAKLTTAVEAVVEGPAEREWIRGSLAPLIGLSGRKPEEADRAESFSAWRRFLEAIASTSPLILVFEDVHWADPGLLDFVERFVDWSTGVPILVVCTARPELFERTPGWGGGKRNSSTISRLG
jgi:class 3 adenylate cyclase